MESVSDILWKHFTFFIFIMLPVCTIMHWGIVAQNDIFFNLGSLVAVNVCFKSQALISHLIHYHLQSTRKLRQYLVLG